MTNDCPYCNKPHLNFGDAEDEVDMWIEETLDGERVIAADYWGASSTYAWSVSINFCPFCGRKLEKVDE